MGLIGPEVRDPKALNIPLDQAEILVTNKEIVGKELQNSARAVRRPARSSPSSAAGSDPDRPRHQARSAST